MTTQLAVPGRTETRKFTRAGNVFDALQHEVDRIFDSFSRELTGAPTPGTPAIDVAETEKEIEITAELPGLSDADVQISLVGDVLTVRGEKKSEREQKDKDYRIVERSFGSFSRAVQLPPGVDASAINAVMANGVLKISVLKPEQKTATRIAVKAGA